jgi:hypothetical protein
LTDDIVQFVGKNDTAVSTDTITVTPSESGSELTFHANLALHGGQAGRTCRQTGRRKARQRHRKEDDGGPEQSGASGEAPTASEQSQQIPDARVMLGTRSLDRASVPQGGKRSTMRALTYQGKRDVQVINVPDPQLSKPTEAIVKIM